MRREFHVRFCESPRVQSPRATRLVIGCSTERDASRVMEVLPKRFGRYNLTLNRAKTRLVDFRRPPRDGGGPGTFELLGFTHFWGTSRKGRPVVQRKTSSSRFSRALKRISEWCRVNRHRSVAEQHRMLSLKVRGHYGYFGITGNSRALGRFLHEVERQWRRWLDRRSSRAKMTWDRFRLLLRRYSLPPSRVMHSTYALAAKSFD